MSTRKRRKRVQPLLYIDTPEQHESAYQGSTEVEVLYKRNRLEIEEEPSEEKQEPEEQVEDNKANERRRSFNLSKHLGYDWKESSAPSRYANRTRDYLESTLTEQPSKREPIAGHLGGGNDQSKSENKKEEKPKSFAEKSVKEKVDFLVKMQMRTPMTCICKTHEQTWVGTVTAADEQSFTMQTQQTPYLVTINYEAVETLSLDHFS
ncbi:hypothetical protein EPH95_06470 [Salicibibacter halophilus]|uniref:Spore coat protein CotO n=1 Tax=Salicibibacter halophilus TaxID=2502791 RepID=A0A514LG82_9BACI|nr:CotO family spore coat protein [Salicibibacter halophilus]QDI90864.1 hypothetical protein EPH95_06470 [Salicibibacter halophilus]